ncbi:uncharacterized protein [Parasteatoda tepidariorum]|uniref:uncharacterized protein n=1 Tax=Parasteatoda tepidariorum TaxID=114398 RepID=UPI0039BCE21B
MTNGISPIVCGGPRRVDTISGERTRSAHRVNKRNVNPAILKVLTYEVLSSYCPEPECRIYTNGSLLPKQIPPTNAGAGVFSDAFSFYAPVRQRSAFDGEIAAIRIALVQLQCHIDLFKKAVVLCDTRAALPAIASLNNPLTRDILDCRFQLTKYLAFLKTIVLQWIPVHCEFTVNENADYLAKKGP